jgi:hypothetical protein
VKKMILFSLLIAFVIFFSLGNNSFAAMDHMWKGSGGWGHGSKFKIMYDPKTVETITGEVTRIDEISPMKGMSHGIHVMI